MFLTRKEQSLWLRQLCSGKQEKNQSRKTGKTQGQGKGGEQAGAWSVSRRALSAQNCSGNIPGMQWVTGTGSLWALHTPRAAPPPKLDTTSESQDIKSIKTTKSVCNPAPKQSLPSCHSPESCWWGAGAQGSCAGMGQEQSRVRQLRGRCGCSGGISEPRALSNPQGQTRR